MDEGNVQGIISEVSDPPENSDSLWSQKIHIHHRHQEYSDRTQVHWYHLSGTCLHIHRLLFRQAAAELDSCSQRDGGFLACIKKGL